MLGVTTLRLGLESLEDRSLPTNLGFFAPGAEFFAPLTDASTAPRSQASRFLPPTVITIVTHRLPDAPVVLLATHDLRGINPHTAAIPTKIASRGEESTLWYPQPVVTKEPDFPELAHAGQSELVPPRVASSQPESEGMDFTLVETIPLVDALVARIDVDNWKETATRFLDSLESATRDPLAPESAWLRIGYWVVSAGAVGIAVEWARQSARVRYPHHETPFLLVRR